MPAAPLPQDETARLASLARYRILDTAPDEAFDDLTRLASAICGTPIALISLVDAHRQWFKSKVGIEVAETPRAVSFCAHVVLQHEVVVVSDARTDPRFSDNPLVIGEPHIRFYAGAPLMANDGQPIGTLCVVDTAAHALTPAQIDALGILGRQVISQMELRLKIAELQEAQRAADAARRVKADFLSHMSHEIHTPMNAMMGYGQILHGDDRLAPDQKKMVDAILRSGRTLLDLINNILEMSTIASGELPLNLESTDPAAILFDCETVFSQKMAEKKLSFQVSIDSELPHRVRIDAIKIRRVLMILLSNAWKYTHRGGVAVSLSGAPYGPVGRWRLALAVRDTGSGIAPDDIPKAHDVFKQASADARHGGGAGLGLAIARRMAELMEGDIHIKSTPGQGTTVTFTWICQDAFANGPGMRRSPAPGVFAHGVTTPSSNIADIQHWACQFQMLPHVLQDDIKQACTLGDVQALRQHVQAVRGVDGPLAHVITDAVDHFDFNLISQLFLERPRSA